MRHSREPCRTTTTSMAMPTTAVATLQADGADSGFTGTSTVVVTASRFESEVSSRLLLMKSADLWHPVKQR